MIDKRNARDHVQPAYVGGMELTGIILVIVTVVCLVVAAFVFGMFL